MLSALLLPLVLTFAPVRDAPGRYLSKFVDATKMARSVDYAAGQHRGKA